MEQPKKLKVIVAHPGRQHSFRVATALKKSGMLYKYVTTVYDKEDSILMKVLKCFLPSETKNRVAGRKCADLDDGEVVQFCQLWGLFLLFVIRIDKKRIIYNRLNDFISKLFQKRLARYAIRNNVDAVICYDVNSRYCFDILRHNAPNIIKIIDNAAPNRHYLNKVYSDYMDRCGDFKVGFQEYRYLIDENYSRRFGDELKIADYHIVASTFSKKALLYEGIDASRIFVVPYGVDRCRFIETRKTYSTGELNILYVGQVNQRKGILQILEAAKRINDPKITFNIVGGGVDAHWNLFEPYEKYVYYRGTAYFEKLNEYYSMSHVFLFPSMGDGFGLVLLEAMAAGLVPITTENCAGNDIIDDGIDGFIIPVGDDVAMSEKILWCSQNPERLETMSRNAVEKAKKYTWERYDAGIVNVIKTIVNE